MPALCMGQDHTAGLGVDGAWAMSWAAFHGRVQRVHSTNLAITVTMLDCVPWRLLCRHPPPHTHLGPQALVSGLCGLLSLQQLLIEGALLGVGSLALTHLLAQWHKE
jgi:hypothetical protein